jgi:hypothetical protein
MKDKDIMGMYFKLVNLTKKEVVRSGVKKEDGSARVWGWHTDLENMGPPLAHLCMTRWAGDKIIVACDSRSNIEDIKLWEKSEEFHLLLAVNSRDQYGNNRVEIHATGSPERSI